MAVIESLPFHQLFFQINVIVVECFALDHARVEDANQRLRYWVRQRPDKHSVHDTEDGCVGADAERGREDRRSAEARVHSEHSKRVSRIPQ